MLAAAGRPAQPEAPDRAQLGRCTGLDLEVALHNALGPADQAVVRSKGEGPPMATTSELSARQELVRAYRQVVDLGLTELSSGNLSVRYAEGMLISPTGKSVMARSSLVRT